MDRAPETLGQAESSPALVSRWAVIRVGMRLFVTGQWRLLRHARWIAEYEATDR